MALSLAFDAWAHQVSLVDYDIANAAYIQDCIPYKLSEDALY